MAAFHFPNPSASIFFFFFLFFKSIDSLSSPSFSLSGFRGDPDFELNLALYGDAAVVDGGGALCLTGPASSSAGRIVYKKPIRLVRGKSRRVMSFSTDFSFSLSPNTGEDGLGFVIVSSSFNVSSFDNGPFGLRRSEKKQKLNMIVVKFTTSGAENGDLVRTLVGIDVGYRSNTSLADSGNFSNSSSALIKGQNVHAWIDYEVGSRQLEVRLAENSKNNRPSIPLLSFPIDFSQIWGEDEELLVGLMSSSSNGNSSSQPCLVYSWSFKLKNIPNWMHSEPLDPKAMAVAKESEPQSVVKEGKNCFMRVAAAMIFGTGCGALTAFVALYLWTIFGNRRPVVPEEFAVQQMDVVKYKKVVVLDKAAVEDDGKKKKVDV